MNNPFKDILSNLKSFNLVSEKSAGSAIGIDIGSSAIKVVEIKLKNKKATLVTYGMANLGPYDGLAPGQVTNLLPEKIAEILKETLKQASTTTTSCALSIPAQSSLVFVIELPNQVKKADIPSVITTEARKYIPVPIDEISLDWFILPRKEISFEEANNPEGAISLPEKTEVLVIAIQNDVVEKFRSITKLSEVEAGFFEVEIFSSVRANFEHELSPVLLMDFGASRTKMSIIEFGAMKSFHIIGRGSADITESLSKSLSISFTEAEKMKKEYGLYNNPNEKSLADIIKIHTDYIFSEANNVLLGYEKKYNRTVSKIIMTGGGSLLKGLKEIASANFKAEIEIGKPFSKTVTPLFLERVLEETGPEFAVAIGLALRKLQ